MTEYSVFLRGINISGKNIIKMNDLKRMLTDMNYYDVVTYLNSGNAVFKTVDTDVNILAETISSNIRETFNLDVPAFVITMSELRKLLLQAPEWWGSSNKEIYDNLIFLIPGNNAEEIAGLIGEPSPGIDQVKISGNSIFWSFSLKDHTRSLWWKKTASNGIAENITIRTANTLRKLSEKTIK